MIRIALESDLSAILAIYRPYVENTTVSFEYEVPTMAAFTQRFREITVQFPWLVWEEEGQLLGYAYASPPYTRPAYRWCAEPTVYLRPDARGRGIAAALYGVLERILAAQGYQVLYALVTGENSASLRFHEKQGYEKRAFFPECGFKMGRWLGLVWLEKRIGIVKSPSGFPQPWLSIVQNIENFL